MFSDTYFVSPSTVQDDAHIQDIIHDTVTEPFVSNLGFVVGWSGGGGGDGGGTGSVDPAQVVSIVNATVTKTYVDHLGVDAATLGGTLLSALATVASMVPTITSTVTKAFVDALGIDAATLGGVTVSALATVASIVPTITSTVTKAFVDALGIDASTLGGTALTDLATKTYVDTTIPSTVNKAYVDALGVNAATLGGTALSALATLTYVQTSVLYRPILATSVNGAQMGSGHFGKLFVWDPTANATYNVDGNAVNATNNPNDIKYEIEFFNASVYTITFGTINGASILSRNNATKLGQYCSAVLKYRRYTGTVYEFILVGGLSP